MSHPSAIATVAAPVNPIVGGPRRLNYAFLGDEAEKYVGTMLGPNNMGEPLFVTGYEHSDDGSGTTLLLLDYLRPAAAPVSR